MEIWKEIPNTDGLYFASDAGRIKRLACSINGRDYKERITIGSPNGDGHLQTHLLNRRETVHKLVYLAWHGPIPNGKVVRHLDDVKFHNYPSNLAIGTQRQNAFDALSNGSRHGKRLLPEVKEKIHNWLLADINRSYREMMDFAESVGCAAKTVRRHRDKILATYKES